MEYQLTSDGHNRQNSAHADTPNQQSSPKTSAVTKRGRCVTDPVASSTKRHMSAQPVVRKNVDVVVLAAFNQIDASEIDIRIEKNYKIRIERAGAQTHVSGELHLVRWDKYTCVVDGLIAAAADILGISAEKIRMESDMPAKADGTAQPAFRLSIPRVITVYEQQQLDVAFQSFRQGLRGQDESLTKDLFAEVNHEAVAAGRRAAERVRRKAGGRDLPQVLKVNTNGPDSQLVTLEGRIGRHPDPEHDDEPVQLTGKVVAILSEDHKIWIRCYDYKDKKGMAVSSTRGKKCVINYSDKEDRIDVLNLPLGQDTLVTFTVIPRTGRGDEKLILKTIDDVPDRESEAGSNRPTQ